MQHNIGLILQKRAFLTPNLDGLVDIATNTRLTYAQLNARANQVANSLLGLGLNKGDRVGLLMMNGLPFVESIFGLAKIGAIAVPLNWRLLAGELEFMVKDCGIGLLIFGSEFAEVASDLHQRDKGSNIKYWLRLNSSEKITDFAQDYDTLVEAANHSNPAINAEDDDDLFIMYTSGTTGLPKGVVHTHNTAMWATITSGLSYETRLQDRFLSILPLFHIGALSPLLSCVKAGACVVIVRGFDPEQVWALIEQEKITTMLAVPAMLNFMLRANNAGNIDHSRLRYCLVGAAPVAASLLEAYQEMGICLIQVYGLTESCGPGCVLDQHEAMNKIGSTGKAFFHTEVKIAKPNGDTAAPNEAGEILIGGRHIMKGYWNNPEATAATIQNGWLHTGDIGVMDEAGFVTIKDRMKDMIISGGENIYPAELENVLGSHEGILEAAIIGRTDPKWGEVPVAFIVKKAADLNTENVIEFCKTKLASFKCPKDVVFIDALPRNPSGKILKRVLREQHL